jgi:hypothetical protein
MNAQNFGDNHMIWEIGTMDGCENPIDIMMGN